MNHFAINLRRLREIKGWTQLDLAEHAHTTAAQISHWECGRREPNLANLRLLQGALQCGYPAFFINTHNNSK